MTRWRGIEFELEDEVEAITPEQLASFLEDRGRPPSPFHELERPLAVCELPPAAPDGPLYRLLGRRKTTRGFD